MGNFNNFINPQAIYTLNQQNQINNYNQGAFEEKKEENLEENSDSFISLSDRSQTIYD